MKKDDRQLVMNLQEKDKHYSMDWVTAARETKDWYTRSVLPSPSPEHIKEILHYEPETGKLFWKERKGTKQSKRWNSSMAGKEVIQKSASDGRKRHQIGFGKKSKKIYFSRVVWCWYYGEWPDDDLVIDHINGDSFDNRIDNLRLITRAENSKNKKVAINNTSGHVGVLLCKKSNKWRAFINSNGNQIHVGTYEDKAKAVEARKQAEIKYGYHENHGRS